MQLSVSANRRRLVKADGSPFFYLADTAWSLFHSLTREETDFFLQTRAAQGFTAIQAVAVFEHGEPTAPNRYGDGALIANDPARPNPKFFEHVDWVVRRANELGLLMAFVPTWGDKWNKAWGIGPEVFTPENARIYGQYLGERYRDASLIWVTGGDRPIETETHRLINRSLAEGLRSGDGGAHLITYHPGGGRSSSPEVHHEPWLDFNMMQSGHDWPGNDSGAMIRADWNLTPPKPTLDGEPRYEDHPIMGHEWEAPFHGYFETPHIRQAAYAGVLNGACGHTYGCHDVWQFFGATSRPAANGARTHWRQAIILPGACQMRFVRTLIESVDWMHLEPAPDIICSCDTRLEAGCTVDGQTALLYFPRRVHAFLELRRLQGPKLQVRWYNPEAGVYEYEQHIPMPKWTRNPDKPRLIFVPPREGDWVLRLDSTA